MYIASSVHNGPKLKNSWSIGKIYPLNGLLLGKEKDLLMHITQMNLKNRKLFPKRTNTI